MSKALLDRGSPVWRFSPLLYSLHSPAPCKRAALKDSHFQSGRLDLNQRPLRPEGRKRCVNSLDSCTYDFQILQIFRHLATIPSPIPSPGLDPLSYRPSPNPAVPAGLAKPA